MEAKQVMAEVDRIVGKAKDEDEVQQRIMWRFGRDKVALDVALTYWSYLDVPEIRPVFRSTRWH